MNTAKLVAIRPFSEPDADVLLVFDDGQSLVLGESNLFDRHLTLGYIMSRLRLTIENDPGDDDWEEFVRELWAESTAPAATAPTVTTALPPTIAELGRLSTRNEPEINRASRPMMLRAATIDEAGRSVEAILATQNPARVYDMVRGVIDEVLIVAGAEMAAQIPLLDAHGRGTVASVLGSVRQIRTEGLTLVGRIFFAEGDPTAENAWQKVRQGHLTDVSIGYEQLDFVDIPPGSSDLVDGVSYQAQASYLRVTRRFAVKETSLVPIGADSGTKVRNSVGVPGILSGALPTEFSQRDILTAGLLHRCDLPISNPRLADVSYKFGNMSLVDLCREVLLLEHRQIPLEREEMVRSAVAGGSLTNIVGSVAEARLLATYDEEEDSTVGWVDEEDVPRFTPIASVALTAIDTPQRLARGGKAPMTDVADGSVSWALARYAKRFEITEEDYINDEIFALLDLPQQMGRSCRRLRPDLVASLIHANAATSDGVALFHATHGNLGTGGGSALSATSLQSGVSAMAKQTENGVRLNIRSRVLLVPSELKISAAGILKGIELLSQGADVENLILRSDARLGASGVIDPRDGTARAGTATNWWLVGPPGRTIRFRFREGTDRKPQVRSGALSNGQWGTWIDCVMDLAAQVLSYPGLYRADGA